MSARLPVWLPLLSLLGCWAAPCQADAVAAKDFAYGLPLTAGGPGQPKPLSPPAIHAYTLPKAVLGTARDGDLADLCVFDAHGVQRPMALHELRAALLPPLVVQLVHYPLQAPTDEPGGGHEVRFEHDAQGQVVHVYSRSLLKHDALLSVLTNNGAYGPITQLKLALSGPRTFTLEVLVEASDDLDSFHEVERATLVRLEHGENTLRQEAVTLPATKARYFRLSLFATAGLPRDSATPLALDSVTAEVQAPEAEAPRGTVSLAALETQTGQTRETQRFRYSLPGVFRISGWSVGLPSSTEVAEVTLLSTANQKAAYRVLDREVFTGPRRARDITSTDDDFFELQVGDKGGGIHDGAPTLELSYQQSQLLFAANGAAPYVLAYGSATKRCKRFDEAELIQLAHKEAPYVAGADTVQAGARQTLAGEAALVRPTPPRPLRLYALWAILIAGVATLALVTRKLLRNRPV